MFPIWYTGSPPMPERDFLIVAGLGPANRARTEVEASPPSCPPLNRILTNQKRPHDLG